jgi:hypothetical protein
MYVLLEFYADGEFRCIYGIYPTLKSAETAMKYKENNTGYEVYFQIHIGIMRDDVEEE